MIAASLVVFLFAGVLHEWAWSFPPSAGYGGPMAFFLIQWLGLTLEDSRRERRLLHGTHPGRLWTWPIVLAPTPLLLHGYLWKGQEGKCVVCRQFLQVEE